MLTWTHRASISSKCGKMGVVCVHNYKCMYECNLYSNDYKKEEFLPPKKNIEKEKKKISDRRTLRFMEEFRFLGFFIFTLMNTFFIELNFFKLFFLFPWYIKYMIENLIFP